MFARTCIVCDNTSNKRLVVSKVPYFQCESCKTLFSDPLPNEGMVGGGFEIERNLYQNKERISRVEKMFGKAAVNVLDFGCGHGLLVADLISNGYNATGYDAYNPKFTKKPPKETFELVMAVEVVEHLSYPFYEFDFINRCLKPGGIFYIETSFVNVAEEEEIPLEDFEYISPSVGHSTIFSHHGLDLILALKGFVPQHHINRHVRLYRKK